MTEVADEPRTATAVLVQLETVPVGSDGPFAMPAGLLDADD